MGKYKLYENATRVPLIIKAPGYSHGKVASAVVQLLDLFPTLTELNGMPRPPGLEGKSLLPLMGGGNLAWTSVAHSTIKRLNGTLVRAVRTERYRYIREKERSMLFDYEIDPEETKNLVDDPRYEDIVREADSL